MDEQQFLGAIYALMQKYDLKDVDKFLDTIDKALTKRAKEKERANRYYAKNKEKLDAYHRTYRSNNPEYRARVSRRSKRK